MDKTFPNPYTEPMKRITLADFQWLEIQPTSTKRTRLTLSASLAHNTDEPPAGPLLLAVSDEYFDFSCSVTSSENMEAGLVLYHTDATFLAIGQTSTTLFTTLSIMGWKNRIEIPFPKVDGSRTWLMRRREEGVFIGIQESEADEGHWMGPLQLPGLKHSVSFGWYMSNQSNNEGIVTIEAVSYRRHQ